MPDTDIDLLGRAYDAFNRRDIDAALALCAADVAWPNLIDNTTLHGHDAVREYWQRQFASIDPSVEPISFQRDGEAVIVGVHQVVRDLEGVVLVNQQVEHVYTFRDGLIQSMRVWAPGSA